MPACDVANDDTEDDASGVMRDPGALTSDSRDAGTMSMPPAQPFSGDDSTASGSALYSSTGDGHHGGHESGGRSTDAPVTSKSSCGASITPPPLATQSPAHFGGANTTSGDC